MPDVLIVDDEQSLTDVLATILELDGYGVRTAANGREALERVAQAAPDVVLSDVMMPEIDGLQLCRALEARPRWAHIPVVLMTAASPPLVELEQAHAAALLYKPFGVDTLLAAIAHALESRRTVEPQQPDASH